MRRYEAIQQIMEVITDEIVVCNLGHPSQELYAIKDRAENFYMLGSMGLASSIGLGLALSTEKKIVVIDGDGALLMNLGSLATIGATKPRNYLLIVIDNESYGSTGFQPGFTGTGLRLERIASLCGIQKSSYCDCREKVIPVLRTMLAENVGPACLVIRTEKGMPDNIGIIPHEALWLRDRFVRILQGER